MYPGRAYEPGTPGSGLASKLEGLAAGDYPAITEADLAAGEREALANVVDEWSGQRGQRPEGVMCVRDKLLAG
jgi:hypothetical protein